MKFDGLVRHRSDRERIPGLVDELAEVVRRHEIDYVGSSAAGDAIAVYTWPSAIDRASAERRYVVAREGDVVVARGADGEGRLGHRRDPTAGLNDGCRCRWGLREQAASRHQAPGRDDRPVFSRTVPGS